MANPGNKRSITIAGHRTSISVEDAFWEALTGLAEKDGRSVAGVIGEIDRSRDADSDTSLSAAIRLYVLRRLQNAGTV